MMVVVLRVEVVLVVAADEEMVSAARKCQVAEISQSAFVHCAPKLSIT